MANITELMSKRDKLKTITKNINNVKVKINCYLDVDAFASIVQTVAQSTFTNSSKESTKSKEANSSEIDTESKGTNSPATNTGDYGEYHAENREIARRYCIIKYMTDIELGNANVAEIFKATQSGDWYTKIEKKVVKLPLWSVVESAIDKQIDYIIKTRQTAFDKFCADLSAIIKTDNTQSLADVKEVLEMLNKVDKREFVEAVVEQNVKKNKKK